jgi:trehalose/maltose hydrolase-like predicted phosphorylase
MKHVLEPTSDAAWVMDAKGYDPLRETIVESRFTLSNGFLGVRGGRATTRGARWRIPARTYVAGLFDTLGADHAIPGLVPAPDWLNGRILLSGRPLVQHPRDVTSYRMTLDMRRGVVLTEGHNAKSGELGIHARALRLVSLSERSIGLQLIQFEIEDGAGEVMFEASFEGIDLDLVSERIEPNLGVWRTQHSGKRLAIAAIASLQVDGQELPPTAQSELKSSWTWTARPGQLVRFERTVAFIRSDTETEDPAAEARQKLGAARGVGWRGVIAAHEAAWASRWHSSDVAVEGDAAAQRALRFAVYHLNGAANPADERVSIGARALTGDDYHGHVFWDTEIYLLPFYTLTWPEAARSLLMYRFHTLGGARAKATAMGWRGALYAWESADTGAETTPEQIVMPDRRVVEVLCGRQEQHISADVAYAVWQYWHATSDEGFLCDAGAEIMLETARFWASRAQLEADGLHHIRGVIGPDEYHEHIDDNAYTNVMARWNIRRALDVAALLRERWPECWTRLSNHLGLNDSELKVWSTVAEAMAVCVDPETGLLEQFAGYFKLEDIDLTHYAGRSVPMDMVLGRDRIQRSQVVKQADVVALLGLLPEAFSPEAVAQNFQYYEPRCGHGSSLSPALHGLVAARLDDPVTALRYFRQTAAIDLADTHVQTDGGVHIAALGGIWMLAVLGFGGVSVRAEDLAINPRLPVEWRSLAFKVQWRGRCVGIRVDQDGHLLEATLESGDPMTITIGDEQHDLQPRSPLRVVTGRPSRQ